MQPYLRVEHHLLRDGAAFSSVHEKMIFLLLQSYAGRDGLAFPSHQTLADGVPCSKTTVKNCLQTLIEKGRIEKVKRQTDTAFHRRPRTFPDRTRVKRRQPGRRLSPPKKKGLRNSLPPPLYNGLAEIIAHFETEIGRVTPSIHRQLETLLKETSPAVLHHAIEQATAANVRNFNYVKVIIDSLKQRNLLTQEQIDHHEARRRTTKVNQSSRRKKRSRLPDWVERERRQQQQAEAEQKQRFEETVPDQGELDLLLAELI